MARTKAAARKGGKVDAPAKPAPKKAPVKQAKTSTKPPAKAPAKPPAKSQSKAQAKAPAKAIKATKAIEIPDDSNETPDDYSKMKVPQLRNLLKERHLKTDGLKPALIARLEESDLQSEEGSPEDEAPEEVSEPEEGYAEEDSKEEVSEPEKPPVRAKKAPVKSKAPAKQKAPVKSKAPAKQKVVKPKAPTAKKGKQDEFPSDDEIPDVKYTIDARTLSKIIHQVTGETTGRKEFFQGLYTALEDYVAADQEPEEDPEDEPEEKKPAPAEDKPKMLSLYDEDYGAFLDADRVYLLDPSTGSAYAKLGDEGPVPLEDGDLAVLSKKRIRVYEDDKGPVGARSEDEFFELLETLSRASQKIYEERSDKKVKVTVEDEPDEEVEVPEEKKEPVKEVKVEKKKIVEEDESSKKIEKTEKKSEKKIAEEDEEVDEGGDDGEEVELDEEKEETDVVDEVEAEEQELTKKQIDIDETTFSRFLQVQHSGEVDRADYVAISKKADIDAKVGEQIMLEYGYLSDKYPQAVVSIKTKKVLKQSLVEKPTTVKSQPGQRRLIKKD